MPAKPSVIFMGTPDFAVPCLQKLHDAGYKVLLVVTQPDRPKGRGKKPSPPAVKQKALELGLKVWQPENMRGEEAYQILSDMAPDYFVVVAFGHILRPNLLSVPKKGAINVHGSLLPKYRGSAPIQHAVLNGDKETGVTTMFMDKGMDTGDILETAAVAILETDTAQDMYEKLAPLGANLLLSTLEKLEKGVLKPQKQNEALASYAPMLKKDDGRIDWNQSASHIACQARGLYPWPGAFTFLDGARVKICNAKALPTMGLAPGEIKLGPNGQLWTGTGNGTLSILAVHCANSRQMACQDFLRGYKYKAGAKFADCEQ